MKNTKEIFESNGIVTLKADKTDEYSAEPVDRKLVELGNTAKAIPYYAVYVPGKEEPIHFAPPNGTFISSASLLDYLKGKGLDLKKDASPKATASSGNETKTKFAPGQ